MAPRSTHRTAVLTVTGLLVTALMYSVAYRDDQAHAQTHLTATPTNPPTSTAMPTMTSTATATSTATQTATPLSTATTTPSAAPTAIGTPSGGSGTCAVHDPNAWHGAVGPNGCTYGHEHGDAPPAWVALSYSGAFNTSPKENAQAPSDAMPAMTGKHPAMKGFLGPNGTGQGGGQFYVRYHAASNVLDRMARFHSFELWYRDAQGGVSHVAGWTNSGVPTRFGNGTVGAGGRRNVCSSEIDIRPEVEVITSILSYQGLDQNCNNKTEHWYFYPIAPPGGAPHMEMPTISVLIDATTLDFANEAANTSMTTWQRTGSKGVSREGSVIWPPRGGDFPAPSGSFWTTQFGEYVSGPSDPKCSAQTVFPTNPTARINPFDVQESYANVCLQQTISQTAPGFIQQQRIPSSDYSSQGVVLPN